MSNNLIEDQITPKRCGHFNDKRVIGRDEMVQKIHAAADARQNDDLIINAGTDARGPGVRRGGRACRRVP